VVFEGKGFGHGVGRSQWGALEMARRGKKAEEIIHYYFKNVDIVKLW
jgi:stage II sporulation protein D